MTIELAIVAICTVGFVAFLAAFIVALCRAAAGGDIQILREYDCSGEFEARRLGRQRSHVRETVQR